MWSIVFFILYNIFLNHAAILQCDFETICDDFVIDSNWDLTDGLHPQSIDHDHTLNTSSGHHLFYNPRNNPLLRVAEIKTNDWLQVPSDRSVCFRMWYFTPQINLPFTVQLIQGDDEQLARIEASITGKDPSVDDWTLIKIKLPSEKFKISIRLNATTRPLVFDDISVDYCDGSSLEPLKVLYECDFESSCSNDFLSLPNYPYQWSILQAKDAIQIETNAPSIDYTFANQSGHYALLRNSNLIARGNVGYLHLQRIFNIISEEFYCLNFQYYSFGRSGMASLKVFLQLSNGSDVVQKIWPAETDSRYTYTNNKWTWSVINLPVGEYSLLFRVDTSDTVPSTFALDNITIVSCGYPPPDRHPNYSLLSFACTFDNLTTCDMISEAIFSPPTFNFIIFTGDTVPNPGLGPIRDYTNNSTSGGFLYWDRKLPFAVTDFGMIHPMTTIEQNLGMCIKFAYYVKSEAVKKNGTVLAITSSGCYATQLWSQRLDDSQGWQTISIPVPGYACKETFYFSVYQSEKVAVSIAFDDLEISQCNSLSPITTSTSISTKTQTTSSHRISTSTTTSTLPSTTTYRPSTSVITGTLPSTITYSPSASSVTISTTKSTLRSTTTYLLSTSWMTTSTTLPSTTTYRTSTPWITTPTTKSTSSSTTTYRVSTSPTTAITITDISSSSNLTRTTTNPLTIIVSTFSPTTTTTQNNAHRLTFLSGYNMIIILFFHQSLF